MIEAKDRDLEKLRTENSSQKLQLAVFMNEIEVSGIKPTIVSASTASKQELLKQMHGATGAVVFIWPDQTTHPEFVVFQLATVIKLLGNEKHLTFKMGRNHYSD